MMKRTLLSSHRYFDQRMDAPEVHAFAGGEVVCFTDISPAKDGGANEDSLALFELAPDRGVLAVADGVGGEARGELASKTALQTIARSLRSAVNAELPLRTAILNGIEGANEAVLDLKGGATTLALVELCEGRIRSYHAGDSSILLTGQRGTLKQQTIPHSPVGYAVHAGVLSEEDAMVHEERHLITNCVGSTGMRIEIGPELQLAARDTLVLCSDGVGDNLLPDEVVELVRKGPLEACARDLVAACRARMANPQAGQPSKPDDLAVVLFRR